MLIFNISLYFIKTFLNSEKFLDLSNFKPASCISLDCFSYSANRALDSSDKLRLAAAAAEISSLISS